MSRQTISIALDAPVSSYGETIDTLELQAPKGREILECGYPFSTERNPRTGGRLDVVNVAAMRILISRMAQVPEGTVDQLAAVDWSQAVEAVKIFFYYRSPKTSSPASSAADDGPTTAASSSA